MLEIERKFLVLDLPGAMPEEGTEIVQGYLIAEPDRSLRVRIKGDPGASQAMLTLKGRREGMARSEVEASIPIEIGLALLDQCGSRTLRKTRHPVSEEGRSWVVDVFRGDLEGLIIAETELESDDEEVAVPAWCVLELTDDDRFYNQNLACGSHAERKHSNERFAELIGGLGQSESAPQVQRRIAEHFGEHMPQKRDEGGE